MLTQSRREGFVGLATHLSSTKGGRSSRQRCTISSGAQPEPQNWPWPWRGSSPPPQLLPRAACPAARRGRGLGTSRRWSFITPASVLEKEQAAGAAILRFLTLVGFSHGAELWVGPKMGPRDTCFTAALLSGAARATPMQLCALPPCTGTWMETLVSPHAPLCLSCSIILRTFEAK